MIRLVIGFLLVFGSVGGIENDPEASLIVLTAVAVIGLGIMHSGVQSIGRKYE